MMITKSYKELIKIPSFEDRLKYLSLNGIVGGETFGGHRYMNQLIYHSDRWRRARREVFIRDNGYDLAHPEHPLFDSRLYAHHINPISIEDIMENRPIIYDLNNLVTVCSRTHNAIHYGDLNLIDSYKERTPNDTCPWK